MYLYIDQIENLKSTKSWRSICKGIGISSSTLSAYMNKAYDGNLEKLNGSIQTFLEREAERADKWRDVIVETSLMQQIQKILKLSHAMRKMCLIYGPAGIGKTKSAEAYMRKTHGVRMITISPDVKSISGVIFMLYNSLFGKQTTLTVYQSRIAIENKLKDSDAMIIIDDADHLTNAALEVVRRIHDLTNIAIAIIGTEQIIDRLRHPASGKILARMSSRLPIKRVFPIEPDMNDLRLVCNAYGVKDREAIKRLYQKAQNGGLRFAVNQMKIAKLFAKNGEVTLRHIIDAEAISEGEQDED